MRAAIIVLVLAISTRVASADGDPIAIVTTDTGFLTAITQTLAPAGMTLLPVTTFDTPAIVDLANASRAIADRERATATVWLLFSADGATLAAYDRDVDRVLVRELPFRPPLDGAQAAQAARMARTMLRALRVTPDTDQLPPKAADAPVIRERARAGIVAPVVPAPAPALLGFELDAGMRIQGPADHVGVAGAFAIVWRPDRFGLALAVRFAPSSDVRGDPLVGTIFDVSVALLARQPLRITPRITAIGAGGLALHRIALDGDLSGMPIRDRALDPALRLGLAVTRRVGNVGIGVSVWSDWLLRRQIYEAGDTTLHTVPLVQVMGGLTLSARIL